MARNFACALSLWVVLYRRLFNIGFGGGPKAGVYELTKSHSLKNGITLSACHQ